MIAQNISFPSKTFLIGEYAVLEGAPALLVNTHPRFEFVAVPAGTSEGVPADVPAPVGTSEGAPADVPAPVDVDVGASALAPVGASASAPAPAGNIKTPCNLKNLTEWVHPQSPAGGWLKRSAEVERLYRVGFWDPHGGRGGFGCSSAWFNFVYWLSKKARGAPPPPLPPSRSSSPPQPESTPQLQPSQPPSPPQLQPSRSSSPPQSPPPKTKDETCAKEQAELLNLWQAYRGLVFEGRRPSGADVVSQWVGEVCVFYPRPFRVLSVKWPFKDLDFFLVSMGRSLNTHEHLQKLEGKKIFAGLHSLAERAVVCAQSADREGFISVVEEYSICLRQRGLTLRGTLAFLDQIKKHPRVLTAKGCGAMGAETAVVFFDPLYKEEVRSWLNEKASAKPAEGLSPQTSIIACANDITGGIRLQP